MGTIILLFEDSAWETFGSTREKYVQEAKYWITRRMDKSNKNIVGAYYSEDEIDVTKIVDDHLEKQAKYEKEMFERQEQEQFKRLKAKYEPESK